MGRCKIDGSCLVAHVFLKTSSESFLMHDTLGACLQVSHCNVMSRVIAVRATDKRIACEEEFSDSEDEGEGGRKNVANHKKGAKRPRVDEDKKDGEEKKPGGYCQHYITLQC